MNSHDGVLVVACLRHADQRPLVDPLTAAVHVDARAATASPSDWAALEYALRLAEAWGGRVLAVSAGPPGADETLREAAAAGAAVLRIPWPGGEGPPGGLPGGYVADLAGDERALARALAGAIRSAGRSVGWSAERSAGEPALVLCGDRSADRGTGAVPAYLAHELGAAQAAGLVALRANADGTLTGERRLSGGRRERLRIPRPAVCSVEAAGLRLRRAGLPATLAARRAAVPLREPERDPERDPAGRPWIGQPRPYAPRTHVLPPPDADSPRARVLALTGALTDRDPPTVIGPVDAVSAAQALLAYLDRNGYRAAPGPAGASVL